MRITSSDYNQDHVIYDDDRWKYSELDALSTKVSILQKNPSGNGDEGKTIAILPKFLRIFAQFMANKA
jgi:hypothetical protein